MRDDIEAYWKERQIPYLLHFTRSENLPNILSSGLQPRSEIDNGNFCGTVNDDLRLDGRRNFNCLSIAFPNSLMFHRFKLDNPGTDWPILVVHPGIMSRRNSLFCWQNAASNEISHADGAQLGSLAAFQGLFEERDGHPARNDQFLKICDPTNLQAEVLVEGVIPPAAIYCVIFPNFPCQQQFAPIVGDRQSLVSGRRGFYGTRQYYRQWGDGKNG